VRVDVDLAQGRVTRINEAVRCSCGNYDNLTGFDFALFIAGHASGASFLDNDDFIVIVPVQGRSTPRRRVHHQKRNAHAMLFAHKFMRHSDKRQLIAIDHAHEQLSMPQAISKVKLAKQIPVGCPHPNLLPREKELPLPFGKCLFSVAVLRPHFINTSLQRGAAPSLARQPL
jgi:hypothetical protein